MTAPLTPKQWAERLAKDVAEAERTGMLSSGILSYSVGQARAIAAMLRKLERCEKALREIVEDPHCNYDNVEPGGYGIGVADGHRCAANKARAALQPHAGEDV